MEDMDCSGLRQRGSTQQPEIDNTTEDEVETTLPVVPPNTPVNPVLHPREYTVLGHRVPGRETLIWNPTFPYVNRVEEVEQKPAEEIAWTTVISEAMAPVNAIITTVYLGLLFGNAKSIASLEFLFAFGQLNENCESLSPVFTKLD